MTRLHLSEQAAKAMGVGPEAAKERAEAEAAAQAEREREEAEKRRAREEREAARLRAKEAERAKRERAAESDRVLDKAITMLERAVADTEDRRRNREKRLEEAAQVRLKIRRLEENLEAERAKLAALEKATAEVVDDGRAAAEEVVRAAWDEHEAAWSALPRAYIKRHRDRAVRKRLRGLRLDA